MLAAAAAKPKPPAVLAAGAAGVLPPNTVEWPNIGAWTLVDDTGVLPPNTANKHSIESRNALFALCNTCTTNIMVTALKMVPLQRFKSYILPCELFYCHSNDYSLEPGAAAGGFALAPNIPEPNMAERERTTKIVNVSR